ncbi:hypothetical protein [Flavobacterium nitrogenifigens]|uniref:Bacteroides conjugative transposon TraI-like protein n=1 Tax=Flavobacterium nitrogenifigens TaxID=1617283 RepID=A0A521B4Z1_9FLAO|nr:hypothetical protein [Flavobacterium nitrogenifigens]KAF2334568.1 hypothetical protein DM397_07805 [Flavobacterium nitrogenifigens]SMO42126.1 hypothetical protein SAMN06265220_101678 [Flavobacterium nitrogenifigens]
MKKIILILTAVLVFTQVMTGQAKQRKELLLQIAALQVYIDYAKKGYSAVSKGLNFIGDVKKGEVNLHGDYFSSLLKVNPKVRNYYKVAEIISIQLKIIKVSSKTIKTLKAADLFHGTELDYVERSLKRLLENCSGTLDHLLLISTDSKLELTDDQRIERIDKLHKNMLEDYNFCISFSREAELLSLSKANNLKEAKELSVMYH